MIYFEKNGFQYSTRVFVRKKAFRNKNNGTIGKSRKKSIDIGPWFFFSKTQHTIMSELNRAPFTRKRHRARSVARFCWTLPYIAEANWYLGNMVTRALYGRRPARQYRWVGGEVDRWTRRRYTKPYRRLSGVRICLHWFVWSPLLSPK